MCGRAYSTYSEDEIRAKYLSKKPLKISDIKPNYNLSPTQTAFVSRVLDGKRQFDYISWGLIPPWEPEFKTKFSTINAKAETLFESRLYRGPAKKKRCVVLLSGFIEWKRETDAKRPFCIHLKKEPVMAVAGIWEVWKQGDEERLSCSIVTTEANSFMSKIHNRMPVILDIENENKWLEMENEDPTKLARLLKPCSSSWLEAFEVGRAVNSPRNNTLAVLKPLTGEILSGKETSL